MGQKVSPHGLRVGINKEWSSYWTAKKQDFAKFLVEDNKLRKFINKKYATNSVSKVAIERTAGRLIIDIFTSKPGVLIGNKGAGVEELKKQLLEITDTKNLSVNIKEVKKPDLDAMLVAQSIAAQLEKRMSFRRAMKQGMQRIMKAGAQGGKVMLSGRLDGIEIARSEHYQEGRLPLHTLRSDIDYATYTAHTTYGVLGVKVWIYKGEILGKKPRVKEESNQGGNA
jgi:small subunit ribosomal protein S3